MGICWACGFSKRWGTFWFATFYFVILYYLCSVYFVCAGFIVIENTLLIALHVTNPLLVCTVSQTSDVYALWSWLPFTQFVVNSKVHIPHFEGKVSRDALIWLTVRLLELISFSFLISLLSPYFLLPSLYSLPAQRGQGIGGDLESADPSSVCHRNELWCHIVQ